MNTLIAIVGLGILCLVFEIFNARKAMIPFSILGLLGVLYLNFSPYSAGSETYNNMIVVNKFSAAFSALFIILTIFLVALSHEFYKEHQSKISDFIAIKLFMLAGAYAMVSFGNLAMFFLGLEVLSISLYVLAASRRLDIKSNEAGMKYFLLGSFASGIILFGICLVYGATGYFDVAEIYDLSQGAGLPVWLPIGIAMISIGMLFKIAAVPFHFWAPDVYEGSPTLVTTVMSTLAKVVAMATLFKLISSLQVSVSYSFELVIVFLSIASMTVGNIMALRQTNVKRMLAFSGISHAGFMMITLLSLSTASTSLLYYTAAYSFAGIAAFAVVLSVCGDRGIENIGNFEGLGKSNPLMAAILTASLLSMAGIPIFAGFFAKLMLFSQAIKAGYMILVIAGVINSIISVGYYFKLILAMYTKDASEKLVVPMTYKVIAVLAIVLNIVIGIYPALVDQFLM